jgi:hypothetical protein
MFNKPRSRCDRCGESITSAQLRTHKDSARCRRGQRRCALCGDDMRYRLGDWDCISCSRKPHVIEVSESETGKVVDTIKFKNKLAAKTAHYQIAVRWGRLYDLNIKMETVQ